MSEDSRIAVHEFEGSLVGSIQVELSDRVMRAFRENLLEEIHRTGATSAVLDPIKARFPIIVWCLNTPS